MNLPNREFYEGEKGGWNDGRLGQAYELITEIYGEQPHGELRNQVSELLSYIEGLDDSIKEPST